MSDYRDETFALQQRVDALEVARADARQRVAKATHELEQAQRALSARSRSRWERSDGWFAIAGVAILCALVFALPAALRTPEPLPCPEAREVGAAAPPLGLFVWGTVVGSPDRSHHPVGERCVFWIDAGGDEIWCGGAPIFRWSTARDGRRVAIKSKWVAVDGASDKPTYDVSYESTWYESGGSALDVDTTAGTARLALGPDKAQEWQFSLDGPATARASSL